MKPFIKIILLALVCCASLPQLQAQTSNRNRQSATHTAAMRKADSLAAAIKADSIRRADSTLQAIAMIISARRADSLLAVHRDSLRRMDELILAARRADSLHRADSIRKERMLAYQARAKIKRPKPISKEISFGLRLNTNGWSIFADRGTVKSDDEKHSEMFYNIRMLQVDFSEIKNPKEIRSADQSGSSSTFIYGKINNFYALNLGYGFRRMIAGKPDPGTVSIHWVGAGGLSVGLQKPYYIKAYYNGSLQEIKYTEDTKGSFLNMANIAGRSTFTKGLGEMKIIPGLHAKTGLHFDFSANKKTVLAAETGINAELYTKAIPIMANQKAVPYFFNLYLSFQFGKRW